MTAVLLTAALGGLPALPAHGLSHGLARGRSVAWTAGALQEPDSELQRGRALIIEALEHARADRLQEALRVVLEGLALAPEDADGLNLLGQIHEGLGRPEEARDAYRRASDADARYAEPLANLAILEMRAERPGAALEPLERALTLTPDAPRLHALRGVALRSLGRHPESVAAFERAWELEPDNAELALDVSVSRDLAGDRAGALAAAERAVEVSPALLPARLNLARLLDAGDSEEELVRTPAAYRAALELAPEIAPIWLRLAEAYSRLAMHGEAEQALRRALELGASGAEVQLALAQALHRQGQYAEAADLFARAAELDPSLGEAWLRRGEALMNLERTDESLEALERAAAAMPGDPRPRVAAAQVLLVRDDLEEAERQLEEAAATGRDPGPVQLALGRLRQRQGRLQEAIDAFQAAIDAASGQLEARYLLGQALVQAGRTDEGRAALADYQERLNRQRQQEVAAQRANAENRARIHGVRARVYLQEGRPAEALSQLQAAVELTPDDPGPWRLLVRTHELLGQDAEAARARARLAEIEGG